MIALPRSRQMSARTVACFVAGIFAILAARLLQAPVNWFNDGRLAPLFMFGHGIPPYPHYPDAGPMTNAIYPPLSFLSYAPALLFRTPAAVVRCAALLVQFFSLAPVLVALRSGETPAGETRDIGNRVLLVAAFVAWTELSRVMTNIYLVHADAPAIFLAALACIFTVRALQNGERQGQWAVAAGICAGLAPWAKQLVLPVVAIPFLFLLVTGAYRSLASYCLSLGVTEAIALSVFHRLFGLRNLYFWLISVPARHPWKGVWSTVLPDANVELLRENALWLAIAIAFAAPLVRAGLRHGSVRTVLRREGWIVYLAAAILMWPGSILGYVGVGGAYNNLLFVSYFAVLAVVVKARDLMEGSGTNIAARGFITALIACLSVPVGINLGKDILSPKRILANDMSIVYEYCRRHPGVVYFPMFPTTVFLAEGRMYHFELGIAEREAAPLPIDPEQFRAHVPPGMRYVAYHDTVPGIALKYAEPQGNPIQLPELPGWSVYAVREVGRTATSGLE